MRCQGRLLRRTCGGEGCWLGGGGGRSRKGCSGDWNCRGMGEVERCVFGDLEEACVAGAQCGKSGEAHAEACGCSRTDLAGVQARHFTFFFRIFFNGKMNSCFSLSLPSIQKTLALARWVSWLQHCPIPQNVLGLIPGQGTYLGGGLGPQSGCAWGSNHQCFPCPPLSL